MLDFLSADIDSRHCGFSHYWYALLITPLMPLFRCFRRHFHFHWLLLLIISPFR
jgi:hypothetical protein